ncbi:MAG: autotransporter outer membrane beta-barrel domain-containing protein [Endomicrobium sp.]|jgi:hypothetical protein|uniref:autotransporter outer membrane beta-barrel domain-containing protein n=1 Tax=Candidatus Endomicrobiellum cubanum TaxID=3242325 RepID=UPI0028179FC3|nr:autotransporter outer membrane beta-barrel domain-containing protein [Endomicrobium sp.]
MQKGLAVYYNYDVNITDTELIAQINQDGRVNPVFPRGYSASIAFLNLGADLVVGTGMQEIVKLNSFDRHAVNSFGVFSGQKYNYGRGNNSNVNIEGTSLLAGLTTKWFDIKSNLFINGLFFEYGNSNFDFKEEFIGGHKPLVKSQGSGSYAGGGLLGRLNLLDNAYCETSIRAGQTRLDCNRSDLKDPVTGMEAKYNYESLYFGLHLGGGYIHRFSNNLRADFYGKYIYTHQNAKEVVLPTEEKLKFDGINSQRIKLGTRFDYLLNKKIISDIYAGIALDHELDGEVKVTSDTISGINSNLKGSSVAGEFGLTKNIGRFNLDLGLQGYAGNKEGLRGALKVVYTF